MASAVREGFARLARKFMSHSAHGGQGGWAWGWGNTLPGSSFDYRTEAGPLWQNSIVFACLAFEATNFCEAEQIAQRKVGREWQTLDDHGLVDLLANPNPFYDGAVLASSTILSLEVAGNAYWIKERSALGKVVRLWYTPHWMLDPRWDTEGREFISYYEYRVNGRQIRVSCDDVVHLRSQFLNPANVRLGYSPLEPVLREVVTDNEAATFMAALLRNQGFPGVIISPAAGEVELKPDQSREIEAKIDGKFTGDRRGSTAVFNVPIKMETPTVSPEKLVLEKVRGLSEERVCAVLGIPPVVVSMGSGLSKSTAKASYEDSRKNAYQGKIVPLQKQYARQVTKQLMPEFQADSRRYRLYWDWSDVEVLKTGAKEEAETMAIACGGPWELVDEVRARKGLPPIPGGNVLRSGQPESKPGKDKTTEEENEDDGDDA